MDRSVHVPLDLESRTQFRVLEARIGKVNALAAVFLLFRELGYCAPDDELGMLREPRLSLFKGTIAGAGVCTVEDLGCEGGFLINSAAGDRPNGAGAEGAPVPVLFCPIFAAENRHLAWDFLTMQKEGGLARSAKVKQKQAQAEAVKTGEMLQPELMVKLTEAGGREAMTIEEKNRTLMLIRYLDNVLGRKSRLNSEFTEGLVADAFAAMQKVSELEVEELGRHLMRQRETRGLALKTEDVLREWDAYCGRVALAA